MDINQLRYFICLANSDTMIDAADVLNITQSALSLSIKKLESEYNVRLFTKNGRKKYLTEEGAELLPYAEKLVHEADNVERKLASLGGKDSSKLTIMNNAYYICMYLCTEFKKNHPDTNIKTVRATQKKALNALASGKADMFISLTDDTDDTFVSRLLISEPEWFLSNESHRLAGKDCISIHDLQGETLITLREEPLKKIMLGYFSEYGVELNDIIEYNDPEAMILAVLNGSGISFIPLSTYREQCQRYQIGDTRLFAAPIAEQLPPCKAYITEMRNHVCSSHHRQFIKEAFQFSSRQNAIN